MMNLSCSKHQLYSCVNSECRTEMNMYEVLSNINGAMGSLMSLLSSLNNAAHMMHQAYQSLEVAAIKQTKLTETLMEVHSPDMRGPF